MALDRVRLASAIGIVLLHGSPFRIHSSPTGTIRSAAMALASILVVSFGAATDSAKAEPIVPKVSAEAIVATVNFF